MTTISAFLEDTIKTSPFLEEGLRTGIINLSALARQIKPLAEKQLYKKVTEASLLMSLKRLQPKIKRKHNNQGLKELKLLKNLTVKLHLVEYALQNSVSLAALEKSIIAKAEKEKDAFFSFTRGASESGLIISESLSPLVEKTIPKKFIIDSIKNLGSITLRLRPENVFVPGVHYSILKALAWQNINIIETVSNYSEITLILEEKNIDLAFSTVKQLTQ